MEKIEMTSLLEDLIDLVLRDPETFKALQNSRIQEITPQMAAEAHERIDQSIQANQPGYAAAAAMTASSLYLVLGQRYEALQDYFYFLQIRYMGAATEDEYQSVREDLMQIVPMAEEIASLELAFRAATLAADCAYFASQLPNTSVGKEQWLRQMLDDLLVATRYGPHMAHDVEFARFVSQLAAFAETFTMLNPTPGAVLEDQLRQLTTAVDEFLPVDYEFPADYPGGIEKTVVDARRIALLSYRYGDRHLAERRLEFAIGRQ
jgi:hypothetical protein